jgi:hypothetical protein
MKIKKKYVRNLSDIPANELIEFKSRDDLGQDMFELKVREYQCDVPFPFHWRFIAGYCYWYKEVEVVYFYKRGHI